MNITQQIKSVLGLGGKYIASMPFSLPGHWSKKQQLEKYNNYIYSIVQQFSIDFAKTRFNMLKKLGKKWNYIEDNDVIKLLASPNKQQSGFHFLELHSVYMKLAGESFWYIVKSATGKPQEMYLVRPDLMDIEINDDEVGSIKRYILRKPDGSTQKFEPTEIIHHKYANPINPYRGMGIIEAAMTYLQTEEFASEWTKNSIYNSGRPSGIVSLEGKLDKDEFTQLKNNFNQQFSGIKNPGKTWIVQGYKKIDYQKLGMDLAGIDLESIKNLSRDDIMFMFRTSKTMMGITDDVNRANAKEMRGVWMENVIKPELDRLIDQLQFSLVTPLYGKDYEITYEDPNPETIKDRIEEWNVGHNKWLTTNDIIRERNEILNVETPLKDGGDELWINIGLTPMTLEMEREEEGEPEQEETRAVEKQIVTKSPACRLSEETKDECVARKLPEIIDEDQSLKLDQATSIAYSLCDVACDNEQEAKEVVEVKQKQLNKYERGEIMRKALYKSADKWEVQYRKSVNKVFRQQEEMILQQTEKGIQEWTFDKVVSKELWKKTLTPLVIQMLIDQSQFMFDFVDDADVQGKLEITPKINKLIGERIERITGDIDNETLNVIIDTVKNAISDGASVSDIRNKITEVYDEANKIRSERIARTETIWTSNQASQEAMLQLPSVVAMEWMTNPDHCEFCSTMNGKIVGLQETFADQGTSITSSDGNIMSLDYESVQHPPLHPNCRCTLLPVNMSEYKDIRIMELEKMIVEYRGLDKRTKEARQLLDQIEKEKQELAQAKEQVNQEKQEVEKLIEEAEKLI